MNKKLAILAVEHPLESRALQVLSVMLVLLTCAYLYFVAASVLNVIARKDALAETIRAESAVATLEQKYFELSQNLTPQSGSALGLVPITNPNYVNRPGNLGAIDKNADTKLSAI